MNNKIIITILCMLILPMVIAISPAPNGECYKYEPIELNKGWNDLSIIPNQDTLNYGTYELDLFNNVDRGEYNLLGTSFEGCINVNKIKFYDSNGKQKSYNAALKSNWTEAITHAEYNSSCPRYTNCWNNEPVKKLCSGNSYWIKSYQATKIVYKNILGSPVGETFDYVDLRLSNGTKEVSILNPEPTNWWIQTSIKYWGEDDWFAGFYGFFFIDDDGWAGKTYLKSYEGMQIYSNFDNINLITNNETVSC